ncbi:hypothetical protein [Clostridium sp.]|uniref:hypothetical protein n=1 Tax=Clostridium sp. TaxID=1506 RepID=UPI0026169FEF|nr:hypothetical protein [Clostridium sp.]
MEESKNKELKVKSFRVTEETFDKFKKIASDEFGNQGQCLDALISLYEMENSKSTLIERKLEIESFQDYLNKINQLFLTSLQMSEDAGKRAEEAFIKKLSIKDTTIERLQRREEDFIEREKKLKDELRKLKKDSEENLENIKNLEKDKSTLSQLVARNYELLEKNKEEIANLKSLEVLKEENEKLKLSLEEALKVKNECENKIKSFELEKLSFGDKIEFYLEKEKNYKEEVESYKKFVEAMRKEHNKELELLEDKYSKMIEKESRKLESAFEDRLDLEKRSLELEIKTLKHEKAVLESKLNN